MPYKEKELTVGEKAADFTASLVGSWRFILSQSAILVIWVLYNLFTHKAFDPYPFILLNLMLSMQAAYTGPILMMAGNRQANIDRMNMNEDLVVDINSNELLREVLAKLKELEDRLPPKEEHITITINNND